MDDVVADRVRHRRRRRLLRRRQPEPRRRPARSPKPVARRRASPPPSAQPVAVVATWRSTRLSGSSARKREGRFQLAPPCSDRRRRAGEPEALAGAGDADVGEPALLLDVALLERARVREDALLAADDEDGVVLEPLGVVQRHQRRQALLVADRVLLGDERDLGQELLQRGRSLIRPRARGWRRTRPRRPPAPRGSRSGPRPRPCARPRAPRGSRSRAGSPRAARRPGRCARPAARRAAIVSANLVTARSAAGPSAGICAGWASTSSTSTPIVFACERIRAWVCWPIPRRGELTTRREGDLVGGVGEQLQVGDRVLDLGPLVELRPADHLVGDLEPDQGVLEHPALGVHPVEDRDRVARVALLDQPVDLRGDVAGLGVLVVELADHDRLPARPLGPQVLFLLALVVGDEPVGGVEHGLRRAVVLLEQDRGRVGEVALELEDVADVGAAERIDRLEVVTDHGQIAVLFGQQLQHPVLGAVGVLVLVDEHPAEDPAVLLAHVAEQLEQVDGAHEQVVEVHRARLDHAPLVEVVDVGDRLLAVGCGGASRSRRRR